jgi:RNA polymerase sigma-70 factor, ECF subfamily
MITNIASLPSRFLPAQASAARSTVTATSASDGDLIERIAAGDQLAMQALYKRHSVLVFRFVMRLVRNECTSEDLVSEIFFDVWRKADRFEGRSQVSTWLFAIARNKALDSLRQRSTEELDEHAVALIEDPSDNPEVTIQKQETRSVMRKCLARLSPAHREIIDLVYYHQKKIDDVARIVGIAQNTVKTRMFYARKQLAELLAAEGITTAWA